MKWKNLSYSSAHLLLSSYIQYDSEAAAAAKQNLRKQFWYLFLVVVVVTAGPSDRDRLGVRPRNRSALRPSAMYIPIHRTIPMRSDYQHVHRAGLSFTRSYASWGYIYGPRTWSWQNSIASYGKISVSNRFWYKLQLDVLFQKLTAFTTSKATVEPGDHFEVKAWVPVTIQTPICLQLHQSKDYWKLTKVYQHF